MLEITRRFGVAGAPYVFQLMREDANGGYADLTGKYTGSEELTCILWPGDDRAQTATLPASWDDFDEETKAWVGADVAAPLGRARADFPLETMGTLDVSWYSGMLKLADGSDDLVAFRLVIEPGPGTATAPKTYHTYKDLTDELPFVAALASHLNDQSGFVEVSAQARKWIDAAILRCVPDQRWGLGYCGPYGNGNGNGIGYGGYGSYGVVDQGEDPTIAAALDADQLTLTTATGRRFVEASVYYTLGKILRRAVGMQTDNDLLAMAKDYMDAAEKMLKTCTAEIDVNADGKPEYVFALNRNKVRRA